VYARLSPRRASKRGPRQLGEQRVLRVRVRPEDGHRLADAPNAQRTHRQHRRYPRVAASTEDAVRLTKGFGRPVFAEEQKRIRRERAAADQLLRRFEINHQDILDTVDIALERTDNIQDAYLKADPTERRLLNQAFFEHLEIDNEDVSNDELAAPFAQLTPISGARPRSSARRARTLDGLQKVEGSYVKDLVDLTGQLLNLSGQVRELLAFGRERLGE
jgi:hypothetical protein